jgi:4-aminobutyrate aminotransferase-like enzyme
MAVVTMSKPRGKMTNGFDPAQPGDLNASTRDMIERRARLLGPAYRLFYKEPVEIVRGKGVLLYDKQGDEYLDAYNNVVSVGHSHPRVVEAITKQLNTLCTHTRYLQEGILTYAQDLLATLPPSLGHVMLTCTGSEANDLAMRIAMHHTGKRGIIVTSEAYHGNSHLTAGFSPSLGQNSLLGTWVRRVPAPDSYRHDPASLGEWMAANVAEQIADLERRGEGLAAFIADSLFTSDGIFSEPTDVLGRVAEVVQRAGGLFVADEVQSGFARPGETFWGFERHRVKPDIVTMGKPMGNGYPVAGIAVVPEIVSAFGHDMRYFNTFGGNSVAVAAAQATLDVIRDEQLLANSERVGRIIRDNLTRMIPEFEFIGDVRGAGLYIGVEIVANQDTKTPDADRALRIVNELRRKRVLISATGFHANSLKIRPPLVFSERDADRFLSSLRAVFQESSSTR